MVCVVNAKYLFKEIVYIFDLWLLVIVFESFIKIEMQNLLMK